jgi:hypothetical protein
MRAFITGWLPSLLLNLWLVMVLPRLVYLIVQTEGSCFSLSALERRIGAVFFYWDIFNVFLQVRCGNCLLDIVLACLFCEVHCSCRWGNREWHSQWVWSRNLMHGMLLACK